MSTKEAGFSGSSGKSDNSLFFLLGREDRPKPFRVFFGNRSLVQSPAQAANSILEPGMNMQLLSTRPTLSGSSGKGNPEMSNLDREKPRPVLALFNFRRNASHWPSFGLWGFLTVLEEEASPHKSLLLRTLEACTRTGSNRQLANKRN